MDKGTGRKRHILLVPVLLFVAILGLGVTLAWQSNTQVRLNSFKNLYLPNANLHDDYIAPEGADAYTLRSNKDVYVENSGDTMIYLRVRLTEYLETVNRGSLVMGQERDEAKANQWTPHNAADGRVDNCFVPPQQQVSLEWEEKYFHDYYRWIMGDTHTPRGQVYYLPATTEQKGGYDAEGNLVHEPSVVTDKNAGEAPDYNPAQLYLHQVQEKLAQGSTEAEAMAALGIKKTLPAQVITMTDWIDGNPEQNRSRLSIGNLWVIDEKDGWCYWASPLHAGEATGLLLDSVLRTEESFDSTAEYCINAVLQAVDIDELSRLTDVSSGGATDEGETLLEIISGQLVLGEDDQEYINNGDGSYRLKNPRPEQDARSFVSLVTPNVNEPTRIYFGQRLAVDELLWNGADYTNWQNVMDTTVQPHYNLTVIEQSQTAAMLDLGRPVYELVGSRIGWDGNVYLYIALVEEHTPLVSLGSRERLFAPGDVRCYLGSLKAEPRAQDDPWANPDAQYSYSAVYPGNGPYGFLWQDITGEVVLPKDPNLNVGGSYFHHLGNGVYVRVAYPDATESVDSPVRYYFSTKPYTKTAIDGVPGTGQKQIDGFFPLQLDVGKTFLMSGTPTEPGATPVAVSVEDYGLASGESYTLEQLVVGRDGKPYLRLSDGHGYIAMGNDNWLGNHGDLRLWHGTDNEIGTVDDITLPTDTVLVEGRFFYHVGDGVWVEIASPGARKSKDSPVKYYFADKAPDTTIHHASVADTFHTIMEQGKTQFDVEFLPTTEVATETITTPNPSKHRAAVKAYTLGTPGRYTAEIVRGDNGRMYLNLGEMGYLAGGSDAFLGNQGDWRVWAGADGKIGTDDDTYMGEFTEPFLKCIAKVELVEGFIFAADGHNWVMIGKDDKGNRLIMSTLTIPEMGGRATSNDGAKAYFETLWPARATAFMDKLPQLRQVVRTSILPNEPAYSHTGGWDVFSVEDGSSHCVDSANEGGYANSCLTFPLSAGEHRKYILQNPDLQEYRVAMGVASSGAEPTVLYSSGLRSYYSDGYGVNINSTGGTNNGWATAYPPRMAMWVRLSDCVPTTNWVFEEDFLQGKTAEDMAVGKTLALDGKTWLVLYIDKYGNRFMVTKEYYTHIYGSNPYKGSTTEAAMKNAYSTMTNLAPHILGASVEVETGTYNTERYEEKAVSTAINDRSSATIFVPSQSEFKEYGIWEKLPYHSDYSVLQTRSPGTSSDTYVCIKHLNATNGIAAEYPTSTYAPGIVAACWARFSDAQRIATATPQELVDWAAGNQISLE